jgi:hypothetical protein
LGLTDQGVLIYDPANGLYTDGQFCQTAIASRSAKNSEEPGMAAQSLLTDISSIPAALAQSVAINAACDADAVADFLDELAEAWRDTEVGPWLAQKPVHLPAEFLLGLGASLRLLSWESEGIDVHRTAGLPAGHDALLDVFRSVTDAGAAVRNRQLPACVLALSCANFAWAGPIELNVDVTLDPADEELALEALADFLWSNRHLGKAPRRN